MKTTCCTDTNEPSKSRKTFSIESTNWLRDTETTNDTMTDTAVEQLRKVRESGQTNMIDRRDVQHVAAEEGFDELVLFIEDNGVDAYSDLLMRL
jgi:hypothetical protein